MVGGFDPERRHRRSVRLPSYNYAGAGGYFVTLCTYERVCSLGTLCDGRMELTAAGHIVERIWLLLPQRFPRVALDAFVVMPNHVHGVLVMHEGAAAAGEDAPAPPPTEPRQERDSWREQEPRRERGSLRPAAEVRRTRVVRSGPGAWAPAGVAAGSLGAVVGAFKSAAARRINTLRGPARAQAGSPVWQRSYYEHVIRDDEDLARIRRYIADNPYRWGQDEHNPNFPWRAGAVPPA